MDAQQALKRLKNGNEAYLGNGQFTGDVGKEKRATLTQGQHPYAVVLTCADSRVVPEAIFGAGLGELFVVRVAGNVVDDATLGSIEYAVAHLGAKTVVVLGHTSCGAVAAALAGELHGKVGHLTRRIVANLQGVRRPEAACRLNATAGAKALQKALGEEATVVAALYDIQTGEVEWL